jgi:hypothetical protein
MKLIYIYVKRLPNGLLYLGKTVQNPYKYLGSGTIWLRSIKKHNYTIKDINTWILDKVQTKEELKSLGVYYSKLFNVVESDLWANLKDEEGSGGNTNKGKIIVNNGTIEKHIDKCDIDEYIKLGWRRGFTIKHIYKVNQIKQKSGVSKLAAQKSAKTRRLSGIDKIAAQKAAKTRKLFGIDKIAIKKMIKTKKERGSGKLGALKAAEAKRKNGTLDTMYKKIASIRKLNGTNKINGSYKKKKAILQYDLDGNFIREWDSVNEARDFCGGSPHKAASGKQKQSNGFIWRYKKK